MCGLFGWIKPAVSTETALDLQTIFKKGLTETMARGKDATGFYSLSTGIVKEALQATEFVKDNLPEGLSNERFVLGHCRWASAKYKKENVEDPKNAQPFEGKRWVLIHNGTINMQNLEGYLYTSQVDSENILAYTERKGLKEAIKNIDGEASLVMYDKQGKKLYFWTDGKKPLILALYENIIFFASTKQILRKALNVKSLHQIFPDIRYAVIYERELLEYDLVKNKFTRKGVIEEKKKVHTVNETSSEWQDPVIKHYDRNQHYKPVNNFSREPAYVKTDYKVGLLPRTASSGCPPEKTPTKVVVTKPNGQKLITYKV